MKYRTLIKENIRHQKAAFIGITILVFLITLALCGVAAIWCNSEKYVQQEIERLGFGDISSWVRVLPGEESLKAQIEALPEVERVTAQPILFVAYYVNEPGNTGSADAIVMDDTSLTESYYIYNSSVNGRDEASEALSLGEIYVPISLRALCGAEIGDTVSLKITGDEDVCTYTVKGYLEDPAMGSSMVGLKTFLLCSEDMQDVKERLAAAGEDALGHEAEWLHIFKANETDSTAALQGALNEETDLGKYSVFTYSKSAMQGFMLILQKIFAGLLLVFVAIFFVVTILTLLHSIQAETEQDYENLGILKAIGFTGKDLLLVKLLQYFTPVLCGIAVGVPVSVPAVRLINRVTVEASGIMIPANLPVGVCAGVLIVMLLLFTGIIFAKIRKVENTSPIRAIRGGAGDVYFKSRLTTPLAKRGLLAHLALRQIVSGKKRYVSVCAAAFLLVFALSFLARLGAWLGDDGQGLIDSFTTADCDIAICSSDEAVLEEAKQFINGYGEIAAEFELRMVHGTIAHVDYIMNIISVPEYLHIAEGRTCRYENEAVVTETVANEQQIAIGDTISVAYQGRQEEFLVTGIYRCANDMGANFAINTDGFARLTGEEEQLGCYEAYLFADGVDVDALTAELEARFGDELSVDTSEWSGTEIVVVAAQGLEFLMGVLTVIFVLVVIVMTGGRVLYEERQDMGIYRALGFPAGKLRISFALRFGMVSLCGAALGILASTVFTEPLVTALLQYCGIVSFEAHLSVWEAVKPALYVCTLFFLFAWVAAGRIKRIDPKVLIAE